MPSDQRVRNRIGLMILIDRKSFVNSIKLINHVKMQLIDSNQNKNYSFKQTSLHNLPMTITFREGTDKEMDICIDVGATNNLCTMFM